MSKDTIDRIIESLQSLEKQANKEEALQTAKAIGDTVKQIQEGKPNAGQLERQVPPKR